MRQDAQSTALRVLLDVRTRVNEGIREILESTTEDEELGVQMVEAIVAEVEAHRNESLPDDLRRLLAKLPRRLLKAVRIALEERGLYYALGNG